MWFRRAMETDPNNYDACYRKLSYLEPKWHGSTEAMLEFGRECLASEKWGGRVPLILVDAHDALARYAEKANRAAYWKQPGVWPDLKASFEKFFKLYPKAVSWRHNYARCAYWCEQWEDLNEQLKLMGPINYAYFGGETEYEKMVALAKEHQAKAVK